jgi:hypothetical protein
VGGSFVSYLPAPYEAPQQDDLSATLAAILTTTLALITSWVVGAQAYPVIREGIDAAMGDLTDAQQQAFTDALPTTGVPTVGWALATLFMVIGSVLLLFRRGRGLLILGALVCVGTTAWAQFGLGYGDVGSSTTMPVDQWPLFWGGAAVVIAAILPATGRWVGRTRQKASGRQSTVIGTTESGAILWPGM